MDELATIGTRLRAVRGVVPRESFARQIDVSATTLKRWEEDRTSPPAALAAVICKMHSINERWLLSGVGPMRAGDYVASARGGGEVADEPELEIQRGGGRSSFVYVPRFDIAASAGPGHLVERERALDEMAFRADWVRRALRLDPAALALITAVGDSMEPTIRAGDLLLIDTSVSEIADDAIYVVSIDGHLMVKRVQRFMGGIVTLKSDNATAYVDQTLDRAEAEAMHVAGRVRWIGRMT